MICSDLKRAGDSSFVEMTRTCRDVGYENGHACQNLDYGYICPPNECLWPFDREIVFEVEGRKGYVVSYPDATRLPVSLQSVRDYEMNLVGISYDDFYLGMDFDFCDVSLAPTNDVYPVSTSRSLVCPAIPYLCSFLGLRRGCLLLAMVSVFVCGPG